MLVPDNIFGRVPILIPALYTDLVESSTVYAACAVKKKKSVLKYNKQNFVFAVCECEDVFGLNDTIVTHVLSLLPESTRKNNVMCCYSAHVTRQSASCCSRKG